MNSDSIADFLNYINDRIYSNPYYFGSLQMIELMLFIKLIYWDNLFNLSAAYPTFSVLLVFFIIFFYILLFFFLLIKSSTTASTQSKTTVPTELNLFGKVVGLTAFIGVLLFLIYSIVWLIKYYFTIFTGKVFHYLFFSTLLLISLSILYTIFSKQIIALGKVPFIGFLFDLILFLPCLLLRFIDYIKYQCKITTKPIWFLLGAEVLLILFYLLIPKALKFIANHSGGIELLKEPVYLNDPLTLGSFEELNIDDLENEKVEYKYHYALSSWFYINPQPPATSAAYTKYTTLLNYGGKPQVQYNGQLNSLRVIAELGYGDNEVVIFETKDIVYQKWNNIVINYDGGTMDVFLNGALVGSLPNVVAYMRYENVVVGAVNGIQGGICNIVYYENILPKSKIESAYRLLRNKKVPL
jgi:hypothetical protein